MSDQLRIFLELGPKGKKVVALAPDWPGLTRGANSGEAAIEHLLSYIPRYAPVAKLAGLEAEYADYTDVEVVDTYTGTGSTDFWGIPFGHSEYDRQAISKDELERELAIMQACWAFFDDVRSRVSAEMRRGPRGGGRDRDRIVRHTIAAEQNWAKKLGLHSAEDGVLSDEELLAHRDAYCTAIRELHAQDRMARTWTLRFLIRHTAYHTLDHTWEMEDKDLTAEQA